MKILRRNAGLTLAELLIAMMVGAMVLVLLGQGMQHMSQWSGRLAHARDTTESAANLFRFMRERTGRIVPLRITDEEEESSTLFEGSSTHIRMVLAETMYPARPGIYEQYLRIFLDENDMWNIGFSQLPLYQLDEFATREMGDELIIYQGANQPSFAFLAADAWQEEWPISAQMPTQLRFALENWPPLILALPAPILLQNTEQHEPTNEPVTRRQAKERARKQARANQDAHQ